MSTQTSEDRDVKDPAEETAIVYAVEITIPTTLESLECGVRLAREGDGYLGDWWVDKEWDEKDGGGSFAHHGELCGALDLVHDDDEEVPFSTRWAAALTAAQRLMDKLAEIDPADDSKGQDDVSRFIEAVEAGEVPELDEPEGDSLPSGDSPLSELDELILSRQFIAEDYAQAKEVRRLQAIHADLKSETSAAKKALEKAQDAHTELSLTRVADLREDCRKDVESRPLLDPDQNPALRENGEPEEPWRAVSIAELGLPDTIVLKLGENPGGSITTLGGMADWEADMSKGGVDNPLCAIPGIGASAAEKISEARLQYFRRNLSEGD